MAHAWGNHVWKTRCSTMQMRMQMYMRMRVQTSVVASLPLVFWQNPLFAVLG